MGGLDTVATIASALGCSRIQVYRVLRTHLQELSELPPAMSF